MQTRNFSVLWYGILLVHGAGGISISARPYYVHRILHPSRPSSRCLAMNRLVSWYGLATLLANPILVTYTLIMLRILFLLAGGGKKVRHGAQVVSSSNQ
jgi:hypothetical protein